MRFIIVLLLFSYSLCAQTDTSNGDRDTSLWRIDAGFNFDYHFVWTKTKGPLGATQNVLYKHVSRNQISFTLPDVQIIFKDKIGLSAGFYFLSASTDSKKIEE